MSERDARELMVWERVEWRQGDGRYTFLVETGGLHATLTAPHGGRLTLPVVAGEGLLDALSAARKTKARGERNLPPRAGARWSEVEVGELTKAFKAGGSIAQLARAHNRTHYAVEAQLDRLGLWDRVERRPTGAFEAQPQPHSDGGKQHWREDVPAGAGDRFRTSNAQIATPASSSSPRAAPISFRDRRD
jgi:hypothetical protein